MHVTDPFCNYLAYTSPGKFIKITDTEDNFEFNVKMGSQDIYRARTQ